LVKKLGRGVEFHAQSRSRQFDGDDDERIVAASSREAPVSMPANAAMVGSKFKGIQRRKAEMIGTDKDTGRELLAKDIHRDSPDDSRNGH